tara:strand:- start:115 stop:1482 length:1368 start_codon:yes stop_codon:yes gene_type:complete
MGGGYLQLSGVGPQDIYLTGNPQITYFKAVYKRYTNFSIDTFSLFTTNMDFGKISEIEIPINGDLITNLHLEVKLPQLHQTQHGDTITQYASWVNGLGNALIKNVTLKIGGLEIDKHYGEWLDIWSELNIKKEKKENYDLMINNTYPSDDADPENYKSLHPITLYIPLRFWFNNNPGLALPLIALQYHKVTINFEFEDAKNLVRSNVDISIPRAVDSNIAKFLDCKLLIDYIYLDSDERRRFTQVPHEYLIETLQHSGSVVIPSGSEQFNLDLNFNNPVKYLVWVIQNANYLKNNSSPNATTNNASNDFKRKNCGNQKLRYSAVQNINGNYETFKEAKIQIEGQDRITERSADYFRIVQNSTYMDCVPSKHIYTYSFSLNPNKHQPSGSCNFSRFTDKVLNLIFDTTTQSLNKTSDNNPVYYTGQTQQELEIKIYAVNYNILRIMSGTAGLAYTN